MRNARWIHAQDGRLVLAWTHDGAAVAVTPTAPVSRLSAQVIPLTAVVTGEAPESRFFSKAS